MKERKAIHTEINNGYVRDAVISVAIIAVVVTKYFSLLIYLTFSTSIHFDSLLLLTTKSKRMNRMQKDTRWKYLQLQQR